ncbi:MAG: hypothetical protein HRT90_01420 [Candidatus Margulisbacteria bacterium]|nr:hypothetical protein [Candidatus Margulisiibacteriota bacterium]
MISKYKIISTDNEVIVKVSWGLVHGTTRHTYIDDTGEIVFEGKCDENGEIVNGAMIFPNGNVYQGDFKQGKRHGRGKFSFNNGDVYDGKWRDGKSEGKGTLTYRDGGFYEGEWEAGEKHGEGRRMYKEGGVYEGGWEAGERHGVGRSKKANGNCYVGNYQGDELNGFGVKFSKSGNVYICEYIKGKRDGMGIVISKKREDYGHWSQDKKDGYGATVCKNGKTSFFKTEGGKKIGIEITIDSEQNVESQYRKAGSVTNKYVAEKKDNDVTQWTIMGSKYCATQVKKNGASDFIMGNLTSEGGSFFLWKKGPVRLFVNKDSNDRVYGTCLMKSHGIYYIGPDEPEYNVSRQLFKAEGLYLLKDNTVIIVKTDKFPYYHATIFHPKGRITETDHCCDLDRYVRL